MITPQFVGQHYRDTATGNIWVANSLTPGDWSLLLQDMQLAWTPATVKLGEKFDLAANEDIPGLLTVVSTAAHLLSGVGLENLTTLQSASFPNLISCNGTGYSSFSFAGSTALTSISAPLLQSVHDDFNQTGCTALPTLSLPALQTSGTVGNSNAFNTDQCSALVSLLLPSLVTVNAPTMGCGSCPLLTTVNLSSFVPFNGQQIDFSGCALSAASVNAILARCVANAGYVSGSVDLSLGTNSPPTGQGINDKATLNARHAALAVTN